MSHSLPIYLEQDLFIFDKLLSSPLLGHKKQEQKKETTEHIAQEQKTMFITGL
uniref:Uncharacterized protein n=1 Tax=Rhizophora mucronata TaxID=61149 RepID=A0A2P2P8N1_RHIMU